MEDKKITGTMPLIEFDVPSRNGRVFPSPINQFKFQYLPIWSPVYRLDYFGMNQIISNIIADLLDHNLELKNSLKDWKDFLVWLDHNNEFLDGMHDFLDSMLDGNDVVRLAPGGGAHRIPRAAIFTNDNTTICVTLAYDGLAIGETTQSLIRSYDYSKNPYIPVAELQKNNLAIISGELFKVVETEEEKFYLALNQALIDEVEAEFRRYFYPGRVHLSWKDRSVDGVPTFIPDAPGFIKCHFPDTINKEDVRVLLSNECIPKPSNEEIELTTREPIIPDEMFPNHPDGTPMGDIEKHLICRIAHETRPEERPEHVMFLETPYGIQLIYADSTGIRIPLPEISAENPVKCIHNECKVTPNDVDQEIIVSWSETLGDEVSQEVLNHFVKMYRNDHPDVSKIDIKSICKHDTTPPTVEFNCGDESKYIISWDPVTGRVILPEDMCTFS